MHPEGMMWISIGFTTVAGSAMLAALFLGPIGRAIGERIRGKRAEAAEGLEDRLERIEHLLEGRVNELEERIEFTERLLSAQDTGGER